MRKVACTIPAYGYKFVKISDNSFEDDLIANENIIENKFYKIVVNKHDGTIDEFIDKKLNHNFQVI